METGDGSALSQGEAGLLGDWPFDEWAFSRAIPDYCQGELAKQTDRLGLLWVVTLGVC